MSIAISNKRRLGVQSGATGWLLYLALWSVFLGSFYGAYRFHQLSLEADAEISPIEGGISSYDAIIQRYARKNGMDWRLMASIISVESSFQRTAVSSKGALGLMQIMPSVAMEQRTEFSTHPEKNIQAGIAHFAAKLRKIRGTTRWDTIRLSLAAYNVGLGHLRDAQNLAIENHLSPRKWENVARMLPLLEDPTYFEKAQYGYCEGSSVVDYVAKVLDRFAFYRSMYSRRVVQVTQSDASPVPRT
ncbi:MAG: transglycosylase SLT domain-containing protein [Pseudomonadota bacterium]